MKASIIIVTQCRRAICKRVLRTVIDQDFAPSEYEIVLVLDGVEAPQWCVSEQRMAKCRVEIVRQAKSGQAAGIKAGLRAATGELVLFLDDDTLCPPNLLAKHVEAHTSQPGNLVFGPILTSPESAPNLVSDWFREHYDKWFEDGQIEQPEQGWCFAFGNPNTSGSRSLLLRHGGPDEKFWRCNDTEFGFRLYKSGVAFVYLPDAKVEHVVTKSIGDLVYRQAFEEGQGEVRICRKHPEYRQFTVLGGLSSGRLRRMVARRILVAGYRVADLFLAPVSLLANVFRRIEPVRRAGLRVLGWRYLAHFFRGAISDCGSWAQFQSEFAQRLPVLAYHRVGAAVPGEWYALTISPRHFERHLRWLKRKGWNAITTSQWLAWRENGVPLPSKPILLTFDDGFEENTRSALPLLMRYGFTAVTAVVTKRMGRTNEWDARNGLPEFPLMSAQDIHTWVDAGMEFASHSCSHPHLPTLADNQLGEELALSREDLSTQTGADTGVFIYPYGEYDDRVRAAARQHYRLALTLDGGINSIADDLLQMRRITISEHDTDLDLWFYTKLGRSPAVRFRQFLEKRWSFGAGLRRGVSWRS